MVVHGVESLVRAGGLEPPRSYDRRIFLPSTAFAAARLMGPVPAERLWPGLSLRRILSLPQNLDAARLVSTPSRR